MWLFLRSTGSKPIPALTGAMLWEILPKIFAHFGAGHLTFLYAVAWTPWLICLETKQKAQPSLNRSLMVGGVYGMMVLADVRWAAFAAIIWVFFSIYLTLPHISDVARLKSTNENRQLRSKLLGEFYHLSIVFSLSLLIAAPLIVPLVEYIGLSTRASLQLTEALTFSLNPIQLIGLLSPTFQSAAETTVYLGAAGLTAVVWAFFHGKLRKVTWFWLIILTFSILFSLGASLPIFSFVFELPGLSLLRVPARMLIGAGFAAAVVVARTFDDIWSDETGTKHFWGNLSVFGLVVLQWIFLGGYWIISHDISWEFLWGAVFTSSIVLLLTGRNLRKISQRYFLLCVLVLVVLDAGTVSRSSFVYHSTVQELSFANFPDLLLENLESPGRIYSPSYSLPQQTAAWYRLELADGVDPMQISKYVAFMAKATGIPESGYSVTLPQFRTGNIFTDNLEAKPDPQLLGLANIKYILSAFAIEDPQLHFLVKIDNQFLYLNKAEKPRAWIQDDIGSSMPTRPIEKIVTAPNHIRIDAEGEGWLVLSEINYPGWEVWVDGVKKEITSYLDLFRAVRLYGSGRHQILFTFKPATVYTGLFLATGAWIFILYRLFLSFRMAHDIQ